MARLRQKCFGVKEVRTSVFLCQTFQPPVSSIVDALGQGVILLAGLDDRIQFDVSVLVTYLLEKTLICGIELE